MHSFMLDLPLLNLKFSWGEAIYCCVQNSGNTGVEVEIEGGVVSWRYLDQP